MDLYNCFLGFAAGVLIGIPLGPSAVWGMHFLHEKRWHGAGAIVLAGAVSDSLLALPFFFAVAAFAPYMPHAVPRVFADAIVQGSILALFGAIWLHLTRATDDGVVASVKAACAFTLLANVFAPDNVAAVGAVSTLVGIRSGTSDAAMFAGFFAGTSVMWGLTIGTLAFLGLTRGRSLVMFIMRAFAYMSMWLGVGTLLLVP